MDYHLRLFSFSDGEDNSGNKAMDVLPSLRTEAEAGAVRKETVHLRKGRWSKEEDKILLEHVEKHGAQDWKILQSTGLLPRTAKSCSQRWLCKLRPDLKRLKFSDDEARMVFNLQKEIGNEWSKIAAKLPGRTNNDVKNLYYAALRKRERQKKHISSALQQCEFQAGMNQERIPLAEKQTNFHLGENLMVSRTENFTLTVPMLMLDGQQRDDGLPPVFIEKMVSTSQFRDESVLNGAQVLSTTPHIGEMRNYHSVDEGNSERKTFLPSSLQCLENEPILGFEDIAFQEDFELQCLENEPILGFEDIAFQEDFELQCLENEPILGFEDIAIQEDFEQLAEVFGLSDCEMFHGLANADFEQEFQQHPKLLGPSGNCQPDINEMSVEYDTFYHQLQDLLELG